MRDSRLKKKQVQAGRHQPHRPDCTAEGPSSVIYGVYPTAESDSLGVQPQSMTPWCASYRGVRLHSVHLKAKLLQYSKNLAEIEKECEECKYFRLFITAKIGSNHEKNKGKKSRDTLAFKTILPALPSNR